MLVLQLVPSFSTWSGPGCPQIVAVTYQTCTMEGCGPCPSSEQTPWRYMPGSCLRLLHGLVWLCGRNCASTGFYFEEQL